MIQWFEILDRIVLIPFIIIIIVIKEHNEEVGIFGWAKVKLAFLYQTQITFNKR